MMMLADAEIERCIKNTLKEDETKNTYTMARRVKKVSPKIKVSHTLCTLLMIKKAQGAWYIPVL